MLFVLNLKGSPNYTDLGPEPLTAGSSVSEKPMTGLVWAGQTQ